MQILFDSLKMIEHAIRQPMTSPHATTDLSSMNRIPTSIAHVRQRQKIVSKERADSLRRYFLRFVGFLIVLYGCCSLSIHVYSLIKFLSHFLWRSIPRIFYSPAKIIQLFQPSPPSPSSSSFRSDVLVPLLWLSAVVSFYLAKFFHRSICYFYELHLSKRSPFTSTHHIERSLFLFTWIAFILLQTLFILVPMTLFVGRLRHYEDTQRSSVGNVRHRRSSFAPSSRHP